MQRSRNFSRILIAAISTFLSLSGCSYSSSNSSSSVSAPAIYCPYLPSKAFDSSNRVQVSGTAYYAYRINNNLYPANGSFWFAPSTTSAATFSVTIAGTAYPYACSSSCTNTNVINQLVTIINAASSAPVTASLDTEFGSSSPMLMVTPKIIGATFSYSSSNLTSTDSTNSVTMGAQPNPIRYAEVRVSDSSGSLVQCAETAIDGTYSFYLPKNSGSYTVQVASRSNNANTTGYVMNNPNSNSFYAISKSVSTSADSSGNNMLAPATGSLEGGAFNILDQIAKAQAYLRAQTLNCNVGASSNYFTDCTPFTVAPVIHAYWTAGLTPAVYVGSSGPISFYLTGKNELYIGGGENGDVNNSDADHYDNSVIVHEYGHFIEDNFGNPDSPGGSHSGTVPIDARLAWGEGWADFFQGAVLFGASGTPVYKDTTGNINCGKTSHCYYNSYLAAINSSGTNDIPSNNYEGTFHEFSITRMLFSIINPSPGPTFSYFSEIWAVLNGSTSGMKVVNDHFKSMARFHNIQNNKTGHVDWTSKSSAEFQDVNGLYKYGTPLTFGSSCAVTLNPRVTTVESYYGGSNQFYNNDFYRYDHGGGTISVTVTWAANSTTPSTVDLQLAVYKQGYTYGESSDMVASNLTSSTIASTGTKTATAVVGAGTYMINVIGNVDNFSGSTVHSTNYTLTVNGSPVCPNP